METTGHANGEYWPESQQRLHRLVADAAETSGDYEPIALVAPVLRLINQDPDLLSALQCRGLMAAIMWVLKNRATHEQGKKEGEPLLLAKEIAGRQGGIAQIKRGCSVKDRSPLLRIFLKRYLILGHPQEPDRCRATKNGG